MQTTTTPAEISFLGQRLTREEAVAKIGELAEAIAKVGSADDINDAFVAVGDALGYPEVEFDDGSGYIGVVEYEFIDDEDATPAARSVA